ncbi:monocyte to macrophage differentiation factor-like [Oscarella lobularis]|uniref:monocyte to macrophage differentiation factor-like n=1 Tax=Oscarella lobularis TaxID=121494 RepID=UPI0033139503
MTLLDHCMNPRPRSADPYMPTFLEHLANSFTHGVPILPVAFGTSLLVEKGADLTQKVCALVFGASLVLLLVSSTVYHVYCIFAWKTGWWHWLKIGDRTSIYVYIASSYTPWLALVNFPDALGMRMMFLMWLMALLGSLYSLFFIEQNKALETLLYLIVGFLPAYILLMKHDEVLSGFNELALGGLAYAGGVVVFKCDGRIPFAHALWHICTLVGSGFHYYAIYTYLMSS